MRQVLCAFSFMLLLSACKKANNDGSQAANELNGRYLGTFSRTGMDTVDISLYFKNDNTFERTGGTSNYPSICGGRYQQNGKSLDVTDTCAWIANFDWTLIFNGNYFISFTGENTVRIWRTTGIRTDEYLLNRIIR